MPGEKKPKHTNKNTKNDAAVKSKFQNKYTETDFYLYVF